MTSSWAAKGQGNVNRGTIGVNSQMNASEAGIQRYAWASRRPATSPLPAAHEDCQAQLMCYPHVWALKVTGQGCHSCFYKLSIAQEILFIVVTIHL